MLAFLVTSIDEVWFTMHKTWGDLNTLPKQMPSAESKSCTTTVKNKRSLLPVKAWLNTFIEMGNRGTKRWLEAAKKRWLETVEKSEC